MDQGERGTPAHWSDHPNNASWQDHSDGGCHLHLPAEAPATEDRCSDPAGHVHGLSDLACNRGVEASDQFMGQGRSEGQHR